MGAPTRKDWKALQDPKQIMTNKDIEAEVLNKGMEWPIPWAEARPQIGLEYGLTNAHGRSVSKTAAKIMQKLEHTEEQP